MPKKSKKEVLLKSFKELALQKPISKITITNITDNCALSQPTFYRYFKDKYDLIEWSYITDTREIMGRIGKQGYQWRDTLYDGMRHFDKNRALIVNALKHTGGRDAFIRQIPCRRFWRRSISRSRKRPANTSARCAGISTIRRSMTAWRLMSCRRKDRQHAHIFCIALSLPQKHRSYKQNRRDRVPVKSQVILPFDSPA